MKKQKVEWVFNQQGDQVSNQNLLTKENPRQAGFSSKFYEEVKRINNSYPQTLSKIRGKNTSKLILWGQHYPNTRKTAQGKKL